MRKKSKSITEAKHVFFTPLPHDLEALAHFETKLMRQANFKDCTDIPDASIMRHVLHLAYKFDKTQRVPQLIKAGKRFRGDVHGNRDYDTENEELQ